MKIPVHNHADDGADLRPYGVCAGCDMIRKRTVSTDDTATVDDVRPEPLGPADCHHSATAVALWEHPGFGEFRLCYHCHNRHRNDADGWTLVREELDALADDIAHGEAIPR